MHDSFEAEKNTKALSYTILICAALCFLFIFYKWPLLVAGKTTTTDIIEINLGNDLNGRGDIQPQLKGEPARELAISKTIQSNSIHTVKVPIAADEDKNQDAVNVPKILKAKQSINVIQPQKIKTSTIVETKTSQSVTPAPKLKLPLYKGGMGTGGNGAVQDNGYRNQGYNGNTGDAGTSNGKADSYGNSSGGRSGISVIKGLSGRKPIHFPSMQDEFNENAKIYVDIIVDAAGVVISANIARGSTTSNGALLSIALQKARLLKFPTSSNEVEKGTILFNFILRN